MYIKISWSLVWMTGIAASLVGQPTAPQVITDDIPRFWRMYDLVTNTPDTTLQYAYIQAYIDSGTPGLKAMAEVRRYTPQRYADAIRLYPAFWASIRPHTLQASVYAQEITSGIRQFEQLYPGATPAKVYFTVGALRSSGTTQSDRILIGSELALADSLTETRELPAWLGHLPGYFATNPRLALVFLIVHEYVHTQQKTTIGQHLLAQSLLEGVAEFVAVQALGVPSPTPAVQQGFALDTRVREAFSQEMFSPFFDNWLWNDSDNPFRLRDMGYYVGYAICSSYYAQASDKALAIREMITLDYADEAALADFVDRAGYFDQSVHRLRRAYERGRPRVTRLSPITNGDRQVAADTLTLYLHFSEPMDTRYRGFEFGPMGEDHVLRVLAFGGFSPDGRTATLEVQVAPGRQYQLMVSEQFRNLKGRPLKPYLISIQTADKPVLPNPQP
ncbi:MAG: hypothetical protein SF053_12170 [Bacteroidia bacterium]|nr:hypothetical protein [Bacteroidia bacterium]